MNRNILTVLLALVFSMSVATVQAKDKVFVRPAIKSMTIADLLPTRVELTKKATIVHFKIYCAKHRNWDMVGARLESDGQTYACQQARIITHDGPKVLADEAFVFGKKYPMDARRDSVILYFDPLPKGATTFDYLEGDNFNSWQIFGIRLDNRLYPSSLPAWQPRKDDGKPLEPVALQYGDATTTITIHGDTPSGFGWFGEPSNDPITGEYKVASTIEDSIYHYSQPAYSTVIPRFMGAKIEPDAISGQFPMFLIPGQTLTLDVDLAACLAFQYDFAAGKPDGRGYRVGGTIGDLNEVLLENLGQYYLTLPEMPRHDQVKDFPEWRERMWHNLDSLRRVVMQRQDYTRRQKDFFSLMTDLTYMRAIVRCPGILAWRDRLSNPDSTLAHLKNTHTLVDAHARELQFGRDGRSFWFPLNTEILPYLEANGLNKGEVYETTRDFYRAKLIAEKMHNMEVQPDSVIQSVRPHFQPVLRAFNDTTRVLADRMKAEGEKRKCTAPDVPGDQLVQTIVNQYPGRVVFVDLWATWCGPCMAGIGAMEPLKKNFEGTDVLFVYITDESSKIGDWNKQVLDTPGQHYRIKDLSQIPGITSIPHYYLFDRQGKQVWEHSGFGGDTLETIEQQIRHALE